MSNTTLRTLPASAPAFVEHLQGVQRLGKTVSLYFSFIGRAASADHEYELLSHQTDAELARRGLTRSELPAAILKRFFS